jgi:hypothetical protein
MNYKIPELYKKYKFINSYNKDIEYNYNTAAFSWGIDELLCDGNNVSGNVEHKIKHEILNIISFIRENNIYYDKINDELINNFKILLETKYDIIDKFDIEKVATEPEYYLTSGWVGHLITIFYEKKDENNYIVGIINAGQGAEFHGVNNEYCNGILIINNVSLNTLKTFLTKYQEWNKNNSHIITKKTYNSDNNDEKSTSKNIYYLFYLIVWYYLLEEQNINSIAEYPDKFKNINITIIPGANKGDTIYLQFEIHNQPSFKVPITNYKQGDAINPGDTLYVPIQNDNFPITLPMDYKPGDTATVTIVNRRNQNNNVNFNKYYENNKIQRIVVNAQIIGNCTLVNSINYIVYLLNKKYNQNSNSELLKIYQTWYLQVKKEIKMVLYYNIISDENNYMNIDYYNICKYIYELSYSDNIILPDFEKIHMKMNSSKEVNKTTTSKYTFSSIKINKINNDYYIDINRINIYNGKYSDIFWNTFDNDSSMLVKFIQENNNKEACRDVLLELFKFYHLLSEKKCLISSQWYIMPWLEVCNIINEKQIIIPDIDLILFVIKKYVDTIFRSSLIDYIYSNSFHFYLLRDVNKTNCTINITPDGIKFYTNAYKLIILQNGKYNNLLVSFINSMLS